jgi:ATP adenylyltransferase
MKDNIWAPWRMAYLREMQRRIDDCRGDADALAAIRPGQFITEYWMHPELDERNLVVYRNEHGIIMLNRFPYANGHVMAALGEARPTLLDYEPAQRAQFWKLVDVGFALLEQSLHPQGINMGINQGSAAGAGVPEHLHAHLVPRWAGDTNFMTVVGEVRVVPEALEQIAAQLRAAAMQARMA